MLRLFRVSIKTSLKVILTSLPLLTPSCLNKGPLVDSLSTCLTTGLFKKSKAVFTGVPARIIEWNSGVLALSNPNKIIQSSFAISTCPLIASLITLEIEVPSVRVFSPKLIPFSTRLAGKGYIPANSLV